LKCGVGTLTEYVDPDSQQRWLLHCLCSHGTAC